ncbi:MAG: hypothetical protein WB779_01190 [Ignavibacteriaceae bacterium]
MRTNLLIICLLFPFTIFCQDEQSSEKEQIEAYNTFGVSLGINDYHFRDEYLSPNNFSALMLTAALSCKINTEKFQHSIEAIYSIGHPASTIQPRDVTENIGYLAYSISGVIDKEYPAGNPLELSMGAGITTFVNNTDFNAVDTRYNYSFFDRSWYWSHSLNLLLGVEYKLTEQRSISLWLTLPVFSLVSRPENEHYYNDNNMKVINNFFTAATQGKPEFLWSSVVLLFETEYSQPISSNLDIQATYRFSYSSSDRTLPLKMYMNNLLAGINWKF